MWSLTRTKRSAESRSLSARYSTSDEREEPRFTEFLDQSSFFLGLGLVSKEHHCSHVRGQHGNRHEGRRRITFHLMRQLGRGSGLLGLHPGKEKHTWQREKACKTQNKQANNTCVTRMRAGSSGAAADGDGLLFKGPPPPPIFVSPSGFSKSGSGLIFRGAKGGCDPWMDLSGGHLRGVLRCLAQWKNTNCKL